MNQIILVNSHDQEVGLMDKLEAHQKGLLHRAVSVFLFNSEGKLLLQQRSKTKYHSGGLWTNTACSHPYPGETTLNAAIRRLNEEMGIEANLQEAFHFTYRAEFENGLVEHEYDHVYVGSSDLSPDPAPDEVMDFTYHSLEEIENKLITTPELFTEWFKLCYKYAFQYYNQK
ncbi:isopentenyl-diphosphate Delta-isomerase [Sporocytophaga myxococcoides]|uniref:isopentenyl-diphosphate Delta-isomerase n=1 Tax=Sporocytophaga myxococcoides TaxID=153721 RepID=UPI0004110C6E|nr:isopentenyl-diphosphate Delta-isomerase [Sporocytophaga myxococcoides]